MPKKKIKDLNEQEVNSVCDKYMYCSDCPIRLDDVCIKLVIEHLKELKKKLEEEVEVEKESI